jgi:hypothetical protein
MKKLGNMSDEELMDAWTQASGDLESAKEKVRAFSQEHDRRLTEASAQEAFEKLTDKEREALAQIFIAEGIESKESVMDNG